jgi:hypothetical protein
MSHKTNAPKDCFYLAHNSTNVFHYGEIANGTPIATGQPTLEFLDTKELLQARVEELGGTFHWREEDPTPPVVNLTP